MSLNRLGPTIRDQVAVADGERSDRENLLNELRRLNNYLALMTNETDPPNEQEDGIT